MPAHELVFDAAANSAWTAVLIVAALSAAVCIGLLYRFERHLLPRRLGYVLLALRLTAVGLLLLALLEPHIRTTYERRQSGRIVVAVDVSESMETADRSLSDAEALRIARALGMIGNAATETQLDTWQSALDQHQEPAWITDADAANPEQAEALKTARRRNLDALRNEIAALPRIEVVRRLLESGKSSVLDRLADIAPIERQVFAGAISDSTADRFLEQLADPDASLKPETSNLAHPLQNSGSDAPVVAVVMLTDGRDTENRDASQLAATARSAGAPVYPVLMGSEQRPKDLALNDINAPAAVFLDDHPVVRVNLRTTGFTGQPIEVSLSNEGTGDAGAPLKQTVTPTGDATEVEFQLHANALGRQRYAVTVSPQPGEVREDNNARGFAINVVNDRARVLLIDSDPRWEFRYLVAALERDSHVEAKPVLFQQPYLGVLPDTFFSRTLPTENGEDSKTPTPFDDFDAVLVGDVSPQEMPAEVWTSLEKYVRESGGTLVLIAGKQSMPSAYTGDTLRGLLPVEQIEEIDSNAVDAVRRPEDRGFRLHLTPDGETAGVLALDGDAAQSRRIWNRLPGHTWGLRGKAKPGSTVWATAVRADEQADLEAERAAAVLVEQHLGAGRVIWLGIDSTWRWRSHHGDLYHHRFWGQLVRSAAEFKAAAHNDVVQFGPERPQIEVGETAPFRARWTELFLKQHPDVKASVELTRVDDPDAAGSITVALVVDTERQHDFEARVPGLAAGEYRARLVAENAGEELGDISAEFTVLAKSTPELSDLTANRPLLEQIAQASGGELLLPDELAALPERLSGKTSSDQVRRTVPLWNHWAVLLVFCGLVGTEWLLRKLNGLP